MGDRLRLALSHTKGEHWLAFERLASAFLSSEYGELRTLASPTGDKGRDAALYQPDGESAYALQYSVESRWDDKIRRTLRKITSEHAAVHTLIYATPLLLGAQADEVKREARTKYAVNLDIRDGHWFSERESASRLHEAAADEFCRRVIDFALPAASSLDRTGAVLNSHETQAALVYLALQREDEQQYRQLTKQSFAALVKSALRDTDVDHRMEREAVVDEIHGICPSHDVSEIALYVDNALSKLSRGGSAVVRHHKQDDTFCLSYAARLSLAEGMARMAVLNEAFDAEIEEQLRFVADGVGNDLSMIEIDSVIVRLRRVLERFLMERGEAFVDSLRLGEPIAFACAELSEVARQDLLDHPDTSSLRGSMEQMISEAIERILVAPSTRAEPLLRSVAEAYTLLAFLRESPNVQRAVSKLFTDGDIWLDTTAVLPLLAEDLLDPPLRGYSRVIDAAIDAGVNFYVTHGVIDEVNRHIDNSVNAWRAPDSWPGARTPFLLSAFIWSGRPNSEFPRWVETFRGVARPLDDVEAYLLKQRRIKACDLSDHVSRLPDQVRWHADTYWQRVHEQRRRRDDDRAPDATMIRELAAHDVENFLGVIGRRQHEHVDGAFGYRSWWLTMDRHAARAATEIGTASGVELQSPVLSFDFLSNYLTVAPARLQLKRPRLPLALDTSLIDASPKVLLDAADEVRRDLHGVPEHVVERRVRDHLDKEKLRKRRVGKTTLEVIEEDLHIAFGKQQARQNHPSGRPR